MGAPVVHTAADVEAMAWQQDPGRPGVAHKVLWQAPGTVIGLMRLDPGTRNPEHVHHDAHHHIWLVSGECDLLGRTVTAGAHVYVPPGTPHAEVNASAAPCVFFYTFRTLSDPQADLERVVPA